MEAGLNVTVPKSAVSEKATEEAYEPLLPVEKKLIIASLVLGVVLLVVLIWLSKTYF